MIYFPYMVIVEEYFKPLSKKKVTAAGKLYCHEWKLQISITVKTTLLK